MALYITYGSDENGNIMTFKNVTLTRNSFNEMNYVGQFDCKCLIFINNLGQLLMFDQHASAERIKYENLQKKFSSETSQKQYQLPKSIQMTPAFVPSVETLEKLSLLGFSSQTSNSNYHLVAVPFLLWMKCYKKKKSAMHLLLIELEEFSKIYSLDGIPHFISEKLKMIACREALKFGQRITMEEAVKLIESLRCCELPFECAHGRPTVSIIGKVI